MDNLTPIQDIGGILAKRDDLFTKAGVFGGKVRTCWVLASHAKAGLVTASSRSSPQAVIVASIAKELGIGCRIHMPSGKHTTQMDIAESRGAEIVQHRPGYNSVIIARARSDVWSRGWTEIPFGMECKEAVTQTSLQVANLPNVERVVVPVGSGMSLAGVLQGLKMLEHRINGWKMPKVLGVTVGADPVKRLDMYAPIGWCDMVTLVEPGMSYSMHLDGVYLGDIHLDPVYESKCVQFLNPGDLFWIVGIREGLNG